MHVGGIGAVLDVVPASSGQCGFERGSPLFVGLREAPHLVRGEAELAEHHSERSAGVDRVKELHPYGGRESLLRIAPSACPGGVALELAASGAATSRVPSRDRSVGRTSAAPSALGIGKLANLLQLLGVHGGARSSPRESQRRTTGGEALHTAAAWRTEVTSSCRLTTRTVASPHRSTRIDLGYALGAARRGEELFAAGTFNARLAVDLEELDKWVRVGWGRRRGAWVPYPDTED